MLFEVGLELLSGFIGIQQKFLTRPESEPAHVAIGHAGCGPYESYDSHVPLGHALHDGKRGITESNAYQPAAVSSKLSTRSLSSLLRPRPLLSSGDANVPQEGRYWHL